MRLKEAIMIGGAALLINGLLKVSSQQDDDQNQQTDSFDDQDQVVPMPDTEEEPETMDPAFQAKLERQQRINRLREQTPCRFNDGIDEQEFDRIVRQQISLTNGICNAHVHDAKVVGVIKKPDEVSFTLDFNNWGHLDGTFWIYTEDTDTRIIRAFGELIQGAVKQNLKDKRIVVPDYSNFVDNNSSLDGIDTLSYDYRGGLFSKLFHKPEDIFMDVSSSDLVAENVYAVVSMLKYLGFRRVESIPVEDIDQNSTYYLYEIQNIMINDNSQFAYGDVFPDNAVVELTYHIKKTICMPYRVDRLKKMTYLDVNELLHKSGYTNIYRRPLHDLVIGVFKKEGTVKTVLVEDKDGNEVPIESEKAYDFDTRIVIVYHSFHE